MPLGNRRLYFHGFLFLALAPFAGFLIMAPVSNPRAMLSVHLACWLGGAILAAAAAAFPHLATSEMTQRLTQHGLIAGMWIGLLLASIPAFFGSPTLFAGAGMSPPAWTDGVIKVLQLAITVTLVPALIAMAVGLGKSKA